MMLVWQLYIETEGREEHDLYLDGLNIHVEIMYGKSGILHLGLTFMGLYTQ